MPREVLSKQQRGALRRWTRPTVMTDKSEVERIEYCKSLVVRLTNGETCAQVADSLGVHQAALNQWLLKYAEDDWRMAQIANALVRVDSADADFSSASDMLEIARTREQQISARWKLERLCKRLFGNQPEQISSGTAVNITLNLGAPAPRTIDHDEEGEE